jgi:chromosome segregation ATPase
MDKYAAENAEMRELLKAQDEDLKQYQLAVSELKGDLQDAEDDADELREALEVAGRRLASVEGTLAEERAASARLARQLEERSGEVALKARLLEEAGARAAVEAARSAAAAAAAERALGSLGAEVRALKDSTRVREMEEEAAAVRGELARVGALNAELASHVDAHASEVEALRRELADAERTTRGAVEEAVDGERRRWADAARGAELASAALRDERARYDEAMAQKGEAESALGEARGRLAAYERGYGLEDAVSEQERLRDAVRRRDGDIARLTRTAGAQMDAYDTLMEVARRLALEAGRGAVGDVFSLYPELPLRGAIESTAERLRSVNHELQRQNDALEEQRLRLLRQLRVHAEQVGTHGGEGGGGALRYFGLSEEQLFAVNEFAENLRDGKIGRDAFPVNDRTMELLDEVRVLRVRLEESQGLVAVAQGEAARARDAAAGAASAAVTAAAADASAAKEREAGRQAALLRDAMNGLAEENKRLRERLEPLLEGGSVAAALAAAGAAAADAPPLLLANGAPSAAAASSGGADAALRGQVAALQAALSNALAELAAARADGGVAGAPTPRPADAYASGAAGAPTPRTPAGARLLTLRRAASRAPPPGGEAAEWAAEVTDLRGALLEALEELVARDSAHAKAEDAVAGVAAALTSLLAQQAALYRDYAGDVESLEAKVSAAEGAAGAASDAAEAARAKAAAFDTLTAAFGAPGSADPAEAAAFCAALDDDGSGGGAADAARALPRLRAHVKALSRALVEATTAAPVLSRRVAVSGAELALARAAARAGELAAAEAEAHMRARILYLELWKKGAEARLERLQSVMEEWVPAAGAAAAAAEAASLRSRLADALAAAAALRIQYLELRELPVRLSVAEARLAEAHVELGVAREEAAAARGAAAEAAAALSAASGGGGGGPASVALLAAATKGELVAALTWQRNAAGEAAVALAAAEKRGALAAARAAEVEGALSALSERLHAAESSLEAARGEVEASEGARVGAAAAAAAGVSPPGGAPAREGAGEGAAALAALREENNALSAELHKARAAADIAADQVAAVTGLARDRELEVATLREHCHALATRGDDDALIGRLQAQLLSLKASYHTFLRKHEATRGALRRARVANTALEAVLDQRSGEVGAVREAARVKELALGRLVDELRGQLRGLEGGGATLSQAAAFSDAVRRLGGAVERQAAEVEAAVRARHEAEGEAEAARAEAASLREELGDVLEGGAAGDGDTREAARRLSALHEQLRIVTLAGLRGKRQMAVLREEARLAASRAGDYEGAVRALEERLVASETEHRRREEEHRRTLGRAVAEARRGAGGVGGPHASSEGDVVTLEARAAGLGAQLEEATAALKAARAAADEAQGAARLRKRRVVFLEKQLALQGVDVAALRAGYEEEDAEAAGEEEEEEERGGGAPAAPAAAPRKRGDGAAGGGGGGGGGGPEELRNMASAAAATTASLKSLLATKNAAIAELESRLGAVQREREAESAAASREKARLVEAAHAESAAAIAKLKDALAGVGAAAPATMASTLASAALAERADGLERALAERDRRLAELEAAMASAARAAAEAEAAGSGAAAAAHAAAGAAAASTADAARKRAETAEAKLRDECTARDRKIKTLTASFAALKEEFVRSEEEHATALAAALAAAKAAKISAAAARAPAPAPAAPPLPPTPRRGGGGDSGEGKSAEGTGTLSAAASAAADAAAREKLGLLMEQVGRMAREVAALKASQAAAEGEKEGLARELERTRAALAGVKRAASLAESEAESSRREAARLTAAASAFARLGSSAGSRSPSRERRASGGDAAAVDALQRRVAVLEAQNEALLSAQREEAAAGGGEGGSGALAPAAPPPEGAAAAVEGEAARKLRKRVDELQSKLARKAKEAEEARAGAAASDAALARLKGEHEATAKRLAAAGKRAAALDAATAEALGEMQPVTELKARLFATEEELAKLRAGGGGGEGGGGGSARLAAERDAARAAAAAAEEEAQEARARLLALQGLAAAPSGGIAERTLRADEDRFTTEAALREKLAETRRGAAALEGALLERDAVLMEAKLEGEAARQAAERLRKRLAEVQALSTLAGRGRALEGAAPGGAGATTAAAARSKREAELEDLVTALRRVTEKQKAELEKAKRGGGGGGAPGDGAAPPVPLAPDASAEVLRIQAQTAWGEVARLKEKLAAAERAAGGAGGAATADTLRRALKVAEGEIRALRARAVATEGAPRPPIAAPPPDPALVRKLDAAQLAARALEKERDAALKRAAAAEERAARAAAAAAAQPVSDEAAALRRVTEAAAAASKRAEGTPTRKALPPVTEAEAAALTLAPAAASRVAALEKENKDLRAELEAFDLEFFEGAC